MAKNLYFLQLIFFLVANNIHSILMKTNSIHSINMVAVGIFQVVERNFVEKLRMITLDTGANN